MKHVVCSRDAEEGARTKVLLPVESCYPTLVYWQFLACGKTLTPPTAAFIAHKDSCGVCKRTLEQLRTMAYVDSTAGELDRYLMMQCYYEAKRAKSGCGLLCPQCGDRLVQTYREPANGEALMQAIMDGDASKYSPIFFRCHSLHCPAAPYNFNSKGNGAQEVQLGLPAVCVLDVWAQLQQNNGLFCCPDCGNDISKHSARCHYQHLLALAQKFSSALKIKDGPLASLLQKKNAAENWVS